MELPVIDLAPYLQLHNAEDAAVSSSSGCSDMDAINSLCSRVANCLKEAGALVVRDPRCSSKDNDRFLDMMETYFGKSDEFKRQQARPDLHYQVIALPAQFIGLLFLKVANKDPLPVSLFYSLFWLASLTTYNCHRTPI
jgi:hypothetical protein